MQRHFLAPECVAEVARIKRHNAEHGDNRKPWPHEQLYADTHGKTVDYFGRAQGWNGSRFDYCVVRFPGERHVRTVSPAMVGL